MNPTETVETVSRLLQCFPGITVHSAVHGEKERKTYISLGITSLQSLARLAHHCNVGTNVSLDLSASGVVLTHGMPVDEGRVRYSIEIPDDDGRGSFDDPPSPLHIFGIFLARDLKHLGLLAQSDADGLQRAWHGVVM